MNQTQKSFLAALFFLIIFSIPVSATEKRKKVINVLMPAPFADSTNKLINDYNLINRKTIKVNVIRGPRETESVSDLAISSLILGRSPFDVILIDVTWLAKYAEAGWLLPLNNLFPGKSIDSLANGAKLGNSYKGLMYRWPFVADIGLLYYRKDLVPKPPKTPDELVTVSTELQKKGLIKHGYVWQGRQYEGLSCVFLEVLEGFGGEWLMGDQTGLNTPQAKKAANWLNYLIKDGISPKAVTNYSEPEALQLFKDGKAAFMRNWPYAWAELQKPESSVKGKVGLTTMVALREEDSSSTLGSWGFAIIKQTKNKKASADLIKYLTTSKSQRMLFKKYGYTPISKEVLNDQELKSEYPILEALAKGLQVTRERPTTPLYAQISDVLQRELSAIFTKGEDINKALYRADQKTMEILSSSGLDK